MLACKHTAGCQYIFPAGRTQGCSYSRIVQALLEILNYHARRCFIREIRNLMESYQIHSALKSAKHPDEGIGMILRVIESSEHCIFETNSALTGEIIFLDQIDHLLNRPRSLDRHHAEAFRTERIMKADSKMTSAFLKEALEIRKDADS